MSGRMKVVQQVFFLLFLFSCARNPYRQTNKAYRHREKFLLRELRHQPVADSLQPPRYWTGTVNFGLRKPNIVVIHHTAQFTCEQTLRTFAMSITQVSAHYLICKDGTVHHLLNDYYRAWHGGAGRWGNITDVNSSSIGIELDNNGAEPFNDVQLNSLLRVLDTLKSLYQIPPENFIGHADIAPTRKNDPNVYFPWKLLAEKGFGVWYDDTTGIVIPQKFDLIQALRLIGYSVKDTTAAFAAFKRHFVQDTIPVMNNGDRKILYQLSQKILRN